MKALSEIGRVMGGKDIKSVETLIGATGDERSKIYDEWAARRPTFGEFQPRYTCHSRNSRDSTCREAPEDTTVTAANQHATADAPEVSANQGSRGDRGLPDVARHWAVLHSSQGAVKFSAKLKSGAEAIEPPSSPHPPPKLEMGPWSSAGAEIARRKNFGAKTPLSSSAQLREEHWPAGELGGARDSSSGIGAQLANLGQFA